MFASKEAVNFNPSTSNYAQEDALTIWEDRKASPTPQITKPAEQGCRGWLSVRLRMVLLINADIATTSWIRVKPAKYPS